MWNAKELQISKFVEAQDLLLPRFQRKSTWNAKKDFLLALSFFRGLPLGAIVIKEGAPGGNRYLLDGRQRWEALKGVQDPETVYGWAKSALGIRKGWTEQHLVTAYRKAVEDYFGTDPSDTSEDSDQPAPAGAETVEEDDGSDVDQGPANERVQMTQLSPMTREPSTKGLKNSWRSCSWCTRSQRREAS